MSRADVALSPLPWERTECWTRPHPDEVGRHPAAAKSAAGIYRELEPLYTTLNGVVAKAAMHTADGCIPWGMLVDPSRRVAW